MKQRYKLTIAYDGTNYVGWQLQKNGVSIQAKLRDALKRISGKAVTPVGAGRTDSGVHAVGQVAHVDLAWKHPAEALQRALNGLLPDDIRIMRAQPVAADFHAQRDATAKWYRYIVHQGPLSLFEQDRVWVVRESLNVAAMRRAARYLVGRHDFASFQGAGSSVQSSIRRLHSIQVRRVQRALIPLQQRHRLIAVDFRGDGFLKQMVRNMVGSLVEVGQGRLTDAGLRKVLQARDRKKAGFCAPPQGLYLMKVSYD